MVGNFIADHIKGKRYLDYPEPVARGIIMHREIDFFTDRHATLSPSKNRLRPKYRHYAGVVLDMFCDHFLAKNWPRFSAIPLEDFAHHIYSTMEKNQNLLPPRSLHMLPYMKTQNWLTRYAHTDGLQQSLNGMARRTTFVSHMEHAVADLISDYELYEEECLQFLRAVSLHFASPDGAVGKY